jgi:hypothetical protein
MKNRLSHVGIHRHLGGSGWGFKLTLSPFGGSGCGFKATLSPGFVLAM